MELRQTLRIPPIFTINLACFILLLLANFPTFAQEIESPPSKGFAFHEWEIGGFIGGGTVMGDHTDGLGDAIGSTQPAFGLHIQRNLTYQLALRGNFIYANLKGNKSVFNAQKNTSQSVSFKAPLYDFSGVLQYEPLGKKRYPPLGRHKQIFSPYLFIGIAGSYGFAEPDFQMEELTEDMSTDLGNLSEYRFMPVFGGGVKYDLNRKTTVGIEMSLRPTREDYIDGTSMVGNPNNNDWYGFFGATVQYRLDEPDSDNDGIIDSKDLCPGAPGEKHLKGCPDSDGDGIRNAKDACPTEAGGRALKGCPDEDKDGVADHLDKCLGLKGMQRLNGCPDSDWDDVIDPLDKCPEIAGDVAFDGCPPPKISEEGVSKEVEEAFNTKEINIQETVIPNQSHSLATPPQKVIEEEDLLTPRSVELAEDRTPGVFPSIYFDENSNMFDRQTYETLKQIAEVVKKQPDRVLHIYAFSELRKDGTIDNAIASKRVFTAFKYLLQKEVPRKQMNYYHFKRLPTTERENRAVIFELMKE